MIRPISISLSPNTERDDTRLALKLFFQPWQWVRGGALEKLEQEFQSRFHAGYAISFNSGRSSLMAILHALGLQEGDDVLLQAFTCNAVPNPVLWLGLNPVYVDCKESDWNMDPEDLKRKITPKSKAVIVQHTFGLPADIEEISAICKERGLFLIEDCAHALGAKYKGKYVGTFGDAALFSFSRDKVISCVYGGMAVANNGALAQKIRRYQEEIGYPSRCWALQQLLHPLVINWKILPWYGIGGKFLLPVLQYFGILSKAVHWKEKRGFKPDYFPKRLSSALAILARHQLGKLAAFNEHRKNVAAYYQEALQDAGFVLPQDAPGKERVWLRYPVRSERAHDIIKTAWKQDLLIGDWYTYPVAPDDTRLYKMRYLKGTCPTAERLAKTTFNLPTHINIKKKDAETIVTFLLKDSEGKVQSSSPM